MIIGLNISGGMAGGIPGSFTPLNTFSPLTSLSSGVDQWSYSSSYDSTHLNLLPSTYSLSNHHTHTPVGGYSYPMPMGINDSLFSSPMGQMRSASTGDYQSVSGGSMKHYDYLQDVKQEDPTLGGTIVGGMRLGPHHGSTGGTPTAAGGGGGGSTPPKDTTLPSFLS